MVAGKCRREMSPGNDGNLRAADSARASALTGCARRGAVGARSIARDRRVHEQKRPWEGGAMMQWRSTMGVRAPGPWRSRFEFPVSGRCHVAEGHRRSTHNGFVKQTASSNKRHHQHGMATRGCRAPVSVSTQTESRPPQLIVMQPRAATGRRRSAAFLPIRRWAAEYSM